MSAIDAAVDKGLEDTVKVFLEANVDAKSIKGSPEIASKRGWTEIEELLLAHKTHSKPGQRAKGL